MGSRVRGIMYCLSQVLCIKKHVSFVDKCIHYSNLFGTNRIVFLSIIKKTKETRYFVISFHSLIFLSILFTQHYYLSFYRIQSKYVFSLFVTRRIVFLPIFHSLLSTIHDNDIKVCFVKDTLIRLNKSPCEISPSKTSRGGGERGQYGFWPLCLEWGI